jgi:hypothetical protein
MKINLDFILHFIQTKLNFFESNPLNSLKKNSRYLAHNEIPTVMVDKVSPEEREALFKVSRDHRMLYSTTNEFSVSCKYIRNHFSPASFLPFRKFFTAASNNCSLTLKWVTGYVDRSPVYYLNEFWRIMIAKNVCAWGGGGVAVVRVSWKVKWGQLPSAICTHTQAVT